MRITLIVSAFLGLLITPGYAQEKALSKQELLQQLAIKKDQLSVLGKKIIDQEVSIRSMKERIEQFSKILEKVQKEKFLKKNPHQEISQSDLEKVLLDEAMLFSESFEGSFFEGLLNTEDASLFKFYFIKCSFDSLDLEKMIIEWESLSGTIIDLYKKLNTIKA